MSFDNDNTDSGPPKHHRQRQSRRRQRRKHIVDNVGADDDFDNDDFFDVDDNNDAEEQHLHQYDDLLEQGYFGDVLELIDTPDAPDDVASLRALFCLQAHVQSYDRAEATLEKLTQRDPEHTALYQGFRECIPAQRFAAARLTDPELAQKRVSLMPGQKDEYARIAVLHAEEQYTRAAAALKKATEFQYCRGRITTIDGAETVFYTIEDQDPLTGTTLPCYRQGQVFDVPYRQLRSVVFIHDPTLRLSPWLPAEVTTIDGLCHSVFVPAEYPATSEEDARERAWNPCDTSNDYAVYSCVRNLKTMYQRKDGAYKGRTDKLRSLARIDFDPVAPSLFKRMWRWFSS